MKLTFFHLLFLVFCINVKAQFSPSSQNWNIPQLESQDVTMSLVNSSRYSWLDANGDNLPDLVDSEDHTTGVVWKNGSQPYWKVYINTGTSFNPVAQNWNIPQLESQDVTMSLVNSSRYSWLDANGDNLPDLVDSEDHTTGVVWKNGSQPYWKVYLNTSTSVSSQGLDALEIIIDIWPNPVNGVFSADLSGLRNPSVEIFNSMGLLIYSEQDLTSGEFSFDLSSFASGIYYLNVISEGQAFNSKIIKN